MSRERYENCSHPIRSVSCALPARDFLSLRRWTIRFFIAFAINVVLVIPFLKGHVLHGLWRSAGIPLTFIALCLLIGFLLTAGLTVTIGSYLNAFRQR